MGDIPHDVLRCIWCHLPVVLIVERDSEGRMSWRIKPQGGHSEGCADGCQVRFSDLDDPTIRKVWEGLEPGD